MKPLLCLILLLASAVMVFAPKAQRAKPVSGTWRMTTFAGDGRYAWSTADANIAQFSFPVSYPECCFPAFLTRLLTTNLTGKTISATVEIITQGSPAFVFGGQIPGWNQGTTPPHTRLYFSSDNRVYDNRNSSSNPNAYWWTANPMGWIAMTNIVGQVTLTANMDPSLWSNGTGQLGSQNLSAFNTCVANVKQLGVAYGGGSFYDIGVIVTNGVATAFRLVNYQISP